MFDIDKSGEFDPQEFRIALRFLGIKVPEEKAIQIFKEADIDDSGSIDFNEFLTLMEKISCNNKIRIKQFSKDENKKIQEIFELFDLDDSGEVDAKELRVILAFLGVRVNLDFCR